MAHNSVDKHVGAYAPGACVRERCHDPAAAAGGITISSIGRGSRCPHFLPTDGQSPRRIRIRLRRPLDAALGRATMLVFLALWPSLRGGFWEAAMSSGA